jgi:hypothetical protein
VPQARRDRLRRTLVRLRRRLRRHLLGDHHRLRRTPTASGVMTALTCASQRWGCGRDGRPRDCGIDRTRANTRGFLADRIPMRRPPEGRFADGERRRSLEKPEKKRGSGGAAPGQRTTAWRAHRELCQEPGEYGRPSPGKPTAWQPQRKPLAHTCSCLSRASSFWMPASHMSTSSRRLCCSSAMGTSPPPPVCVRVCVCVCVCVCHPQKTDTRVHFDLWNIASTLVW